MHKHLRRIPVLLPQDVGVIYFVTCSTAQRRQVLAQPQARDAMLAAWQDCPEWRVGRYVILPDHLHMFVAPAERESQLSGFVQRFRSLVTKGLRPRGFPYPLWQRGFFDHLLRADESYEQKWNYVFQNPVRHGLVARAEDWPYAGEIHQLSM